MNTIQRCFIRLLICTNKQRFFSNHPNSEPSKNILQDDTSKLNKLSPIFQRFTKYRLAIWLITGVTGFFTVDSTVAWWIEYRRIPRVVNRFRQNKTYVLKDKLIDRPQDEELIHKLIAPAATFNLITGQHGTGKTTLVQYVCQKNPVGTLYFNLPRKSADIAHDLAAAVNYDCDVNLSFWKQIRNRIFQKNVDSPQPNLELVLRGISQAAQVYKKNYNQPAIIFIDNLTSIAKNDKEIFRQLIEFAKQEADLENLVVNFVASEGNTPRQLEEMSEIDRLGEIIEIGDLDSGSTIKYLTEYKKFTSENAKELNNFTGGRFTIINKAVPIFVATQNLNETRNRIVKKARKNFGVLILPENPDKLTLKQIDAWNQIIRIYDAPGREISIDEFEAFLTIPVASELISMNVFAYHPSRETVSFQSRPVELYVGDTIGEPGSEQRQKFTQFLSKLGK